nr:unnamed protein product [Callosobruchus analis]
MRKVAKIQRLAALSITRAITTIPTAALEVPLGWPPLYLWIKRECELLSDDGEQVKVVAIKVLRTLPTGKRKKTSSER